MIRRGPSPKRFYILSYQIIEKELSAEALGVLVYVLSRPDDWQIYPSQLAKKFNCGKDKMTRILKEIRGAGYAQFSRFRDDSGKLSGSEWIFNDAPQTENPPVVIRPQAGKPAEDNKVVAEMQLNQQQAENPPEGEENNSPQAEKPAPVKPAPVNPPLLNTNNKLNTDNKIITYKNLSFENVPDHIVDHVKEFVDHRKNLKKPLTQKALDRFLVAVSQISVELNLTPERVITETIDAGWQSVKSDWLSNRLGVNHANQQANQQRSAVGRVNAAIEAKSREREQALSNQGAVDDNPGVLVQGDDGIFRV